MTKLLIIECNRPTEESGRIYDTEIIDQITELFETRGPIPVDTNPDTTNIDLSRLMCVITELERDGDRLYAHIRPSPEGPGQVLTEEIMDTVRLFPVGEGIVDKDFNVSNYKLYKISMEVNPV